MSVPLPAEEAQYAGRIAIADEASFAFAMPRYKQVEGRKPKLTESPVSEIFRSRVTVQRNYSAKLAIARATGGLEGNTAHGRELIFFFAACRTYEFLHDIAAKFDNNLFGPKILLRATAKFRQSELI